MKQAVEDLVISVRYLWPLIVTVVGATLYGSHRLDRLERSFNEIKAESWYLYDQQDWAAELRSCNTNIVVPESIKFHRANHPRAQIQLNTAVVKAQ